MTTVLFRSLLFVVLLGFPTALAQGDTPHPLLQLLAAVPAPTTQEELEDMRFLDYLDMRASEQALGIATPESWQAFEALDEEARAQSLDAAARWISLGSQFPASFASFSEETRDLLGFDPFEVDRLLAFGRPPATALLLQGHFDGQAIVTAHHARDYLMFDEMGIGSILLRRSDGEDDAAIDLRARNPANPFGGQFGRREPLGILSDTLLANSTSWERLVSLARTFEGGRPSLLDDPDYRAAAEALVLSAAAPELLVQAEFIAPTEFVGAFELLLATTLRDLPPEESERIAAELLIEPLPPYSLLVLGDAHHGDEQLALIALVYPNEASAAAARPVLEARVRALASVPPADSAGPLLDMLAGRLADTVIHDTGERAVLIVGVRYPSVPTREVEAGGRRPLVSGVLYRLWLQMVLRREFFPGFL